MDADILLNQPGDTTPHSETATTDDNLLKAFFFDHSMGMLSIVDSNGKFLLLSNAWHDTLGWTVKEMTGRPFLDFVHPDDAERSIEAAASLFEGKKDSLVYFENRYIHKDGHHLTFAWTAKFSAEKNVILCTAQNISNDLFVIKQEMAAFSKSNVIVTFNIDSDIIDSNENFNKLFGYDKESLKGKKHADILPSKTKDVHKWESIVENGNYCSGIFNKVTSSGTELWVQGTYNPVYDSDGNIFKVVFSFLDITEAKTKTDNHSQQIEAVGRQNAIITFALSGKIISANENAVNLFKYPEITQLSHHDLVQNNKLSHLKTNNTAEWDDLVAGNSKAGEFTYHSGMGEEIYFRGFYNPILDLHGKPDKIMLYGVDMTEEKVLIDKAEQVADAIQKSTGVIEINLQGIIIAVNLHICEMLDCCGEDLVGKHYGHIFDDSDTKINEFLNDLLGKCFAGEFQLKDYKWKTRNGQVIHIQGAHNPIFSASGKIEKILIYVNDITQAVVSEEIRNVQKELVDFVDNLSVGLHWVDENGKIIWANQAQLDLLGYEKAEYIGKLFCELFHSQQSSVDEINTHLAEHGDLKNFPCVLKTKAGALRDVLMNTSDYQKDGRFIHRRCWIQDVTQSKKIEREILKANQEAIAATRSKSQFLSNMSHEIRTPLNGVISMSATLLEDANLNDDQKEIVEIIVRSGEILMGIINNILDFSKIEAGKVELEVIKFSLDTVRDVCFIQEAVARKKGVTLVSHLPEMSFKLLGDSGRVCQILINLLNNAIKFTPTGGTVTLSYEIISETDTNVSLKFIISDTGAGMNSETLEKIFLPFVQSDKSTKRIYGGTGLGLCICKSLLDLMGGTIDVESEIKKGSKFSVCLTFKKAKLSSTDSTPTDQIFLTHVDYSKVFASLSGSTWARILVAEDNLTNQAVVKRLLNILKMDSVVVSNGQEAIDALRQGKFDLVLMDCQMPVLDGFEATQLIREDPNLNVIKGSENPIPIIALTANVVKEDQEKCFSVGMNDYVSKPIRKSVLAEALMSNLYRTNHFYALIRDYIIEMRDLDKTKLKVINDALTAIKALLIVLKESFRSGGDVEVTKADLLEQFNLIGLDRFAVRVENLLTIEDVDRCQDNLHKMEILVKGNFSNID